MPRGHLGTVLQQLRRLLGPAEAEAVTDRQLLERFTVEHDEAALTEIVERHGPMVWGVCRRLLDDGPDAEDAFQATFLVLTRRAASVRWRESVGGWLHGVACRVASRARARRGRSRESLMKTEDRLVPDPPGNEPDPAIESERRELRSLLDAEVGRLPEKYRAPVVLCYLEGKTNEEAARLLGWPAGTVKIRLTRARDLMRSRLGRRGLALSAGGLAVAISQGTSPAVPPALLQTTLGAALQCAAGTTAPSSAAALAEGALKAMFWSRVQFFTAVVLLLGLGTSAGLFAYHTLSDSRVVPPGVEATPNTETVSTPQARSDPSGVPLEARLIATKDAYTLDLGGETPEARRKRIVEKKFPPLPAVDLTLEIRNTGTKELRVGLGGSAVGLQFQMEGPGALTVETGSVAIPGASPPVRIVVLAPGKTESLPLTTLRGYERVNIVTKQFGSYWTEPGTYTLTANFLTVVSPAPAGAKQDKVFGGEGMFGVVTLTSAPVKIKVVAPETAK